MFSSVFANNDILTDVMRMVFLPSILFLTHFSVFTNDMRSVSALLAKQSASSICYI